MLREPTLKEAQAILNNKFKKTKALKVFWVDTSCILKFMKDGEETVSILFNTKHCERIDNDDVYSHITKTSTPGDILVSPTTVYMVRRVHAPLAAFRMMTYEALVIQPENK